MEFKQHNTNTKKKEDFNELIIFFIKTTVYYSSKFLSLLHTYSCLPTE